MRSSHYGMFTAGPVEAIFREGILFKKFMTLFILMINDEILNKKNEIPYFPMDWPDTCKISLAGRYLYLDSVVKETVKLVSALERSGNEFDQIYVETQTKCEAEKFSKAIEEAGIYVEKFLSGEEIVVYQKNPLPDQHECMSLAAGVVDLGMPDFIANLESYCRHLLNFRLFIKLGMTNLLEIVLTKYPTSVQNLPLMHMACEHLSLSAIIKILNHGADINKRSWLDNMFAESHYSSEPHPLDPCHPQLCATPIYTVCYPILKAIKKGLVENELELEDGYNILNTLLSRGANVDIQCFDEDVFKQSQGAGLKTSSDGTLTKEEFDCGLRSARNFAEYFDAECQQLLDKHELDKNCLLQARQILCVIKDASKPEINNQRHIEDEPRSVRMPGMGRLC